MLELISALTSDLTIVAPLIALLDIKDSVGISHAYADNQPELGLIFVFFTPCILVLT